MRPLHGPVLRASEMRAAEDQAIADGVSADTLMARASLALVETVWRFGHGQPVLILCGPGNNGGDGYGAARLLADRGVPVRLAATAPPATDLAQRAASLWHGPVDPLAMARPAPVLLDCLFGTGLSRPLDPVLKQRLHSLAADARLVIAADVPSGVGTDDGADLGAVPAHVTVALGALKPAHLLQPAAALCGSVLCADLGLPVHSAMHSVARPVLPPPGPADHKYRRGLVTVIGGDMTGAAHLCAEAAARSGAGYVLLGHEGGDALNLPHAIVQKSIAAAMAEARTAALIIGPGLGRDARARQRLEAALTLDVPLVLDADTLHLLACDALVARQAPTLLTPHSGEFRALFGRLPGSKIDQAQRAAQQSGATILLKGADTVVAAPDGRVALAMPTSWLATAGTGDVLAGIAGAMLARGLAPFDAAQAAVWIHDRAARLVGPGLVADDLLPRLPDALAACR